MNRTSLSNEVGSYVISTVLQNEGITAYGISGLKYGSGYDAFKNSRVIYSAVKKMEKEGLLTSRNIGGKRVKKALSVNMLGVVNVIETHVPEKLSDSEKQELVKFLLSVKSINIYTFGMTYIGSILTVLKILAISAKVRRYTKNEIRELKKLDRNMAGGIIFGGRTGEDFIDSFSNMSPSLIEKLYKIEDTVEFLTIIMESTFETVSKFSDVVKKMLSKKSGSRVNKRLTRR